MYTHNVFGKKRAPLAEFVMYQISWVQTIVFFQSLYLCVAYIIFVRHERELAQVGNKNFFNKISQKMVCRLKKFEACATEKKGGKPTNVSTCMCHAGK